MHRHAKVASLQQIKDGFYELTRVTGDKLRVFVCECYAFGEAEYYEVLEKAGNLDIIVIDSMWCGYSPEAKRACRDDEVGLFKIAELMAALHRDKHWQYLTQSEDEYFRENGWL